MNDTQLIGLLNDLVKQPNESEWVEFKLNFHSPEEIGERISALSNGACVNNQSYAYLVFGVEDSTHLVKGTTFKAKSHKKGGEDLEHWLVTRLNPKLDFSVHEFDDYEGHHISMYVIPAAKNQPIEFLHQAYIRINTITRKLNDFPDRQRKIWKKNSLPFEEEVAMANATSTDVIQLLQTQIYFDLLNLPYPTNRQGVIDKFLDQGLLKKGRQGLEIKMLAAILFAKNFSDFDGLSRKAVRVIVYKGNNKVETEREQIGQKGYAVGFEGLVDWVNSQLPANEEIGKALRKETTMYPVIAIRELIANALIHQDFTFKGFPTIDIFSDRIEISNPGKPLITPERFIDGYVSRNDRLADLMRRMGFCEEKGSGMDKVIALNELYQLPPVNVIIDETRTRVTMYAPKTLNELDKKEKIRACYQHACLKHVSNEKMTNQTLRERFDIDAKNYSIASRIIRDALEDDVIKELDPSNKSRKYTSYIPFWA